MTIGLKQKRILKNTFLRNHRIINRKLGHHFEEKYMRYRFKLIFVLLPFYLISCSSGIKVQTVIDPQQNFWKYQTFEFLTNEDTTGISPMDQDIINLIENDISNRIIDIGMYQERTNPDLVIYYEASVLGINKNTAGSSKYKEHFAEGYSFVTKDFDNYKDQEGTLVVNFWDRKRKKIVWQATAVAELEDNWEDNKELIQEVVAKLFAKYPIQK